MTPDELRRLLVSLRFILEIIIDPLAQSDTLDRSSKQVAEDKISIMPDATMIRGGFGEVRRGRLGNSAVVAVKEIRLAGDQSQRLRGLVVSYTGSLPHCLF